MGFYFAVGGKVSERPQLVISASGVMFPFGLHGFLESSSSKHWVKLVTLINVTLASCLTLALIFIVRPLYWIRVDWSWRCLTW